MHCLPSSPGPACTLQGYPPQSENILAQLLEQGGEIPHSGHSLGQLMLDEFAFPSHLARLSARTQRGAVPRSFHVPVPINANSQEGGGGSFPQLPITAHALTLQGFSCCAPGQGMPVESAPRKSPGILVCACRETLSCLPSRCIPGGKEEPPRFGTHPAVPGARAISCHLPGSNKEVYLCHQEPWGTFRPCAAGF